MGKGIVNQAQEAQKVPSRIKPRKNRPRDMVIQPTEINDEDKIWKSDKNNK